MNRAFESLHRFDWLLFLSIIILLALGVSAIYSVDLGHGTGDFLKTKKQIIAIVIGIILFFGISFFNYKRLFRYTFGAYMALMAALLGVLFFGQEVRGTKSWFNFGIVNFQPVEFVKIGMIIVLAKYFSEHLDKKFTPRFIIESGLLAAVPVGLVLLQPDFGSAMVIVLLWVFMLLVIGISKKHVMILAGIGLLVAAAAWAFLLQGYQKERILNFLQPARDAHTSGYNIKQAIIAIGAGKVWGRGLGLGSQTQLKFLPESQTDFIFAVIAEELGLVIVAVIFAVFALILYRLWLLAKNSNDNFSIFIILGAAFLIFIQMFINVGMNLGLVPVTGLTLPLVSYGGSSLLAHFILLGIIEAIKIRTTSISQGHNAEYIPFKISAKGGSASRSGSEDPSGA